MGRSASTVLCRDDRKGASAKPCGLHHEVWGTAMKLRHVLAFLVVGAMALWAVAVFHVHAAASAGGTKTVAPSAEIAQLKAQLRSERATTARLRKASGAARAMQKVVGIAAGAEKGAMDALKAQVGSLKAQRTYPAGVRMNKGPNRLEVGFPLFFCDFQYENAEIAPFFVHFNKK